ncbi:MAG: helix-turn-helix domain-containing protein [Chitinophagaceae bacterium]|nr:helix-turn-helix domain-containing protein [Chitinophagaceae bacterium]
MRKHKINSNGLPGKLTIAPSPFPTPKFSKEEMKPLIVIQQEDLFLLIKEAVEAGIKESSYYSQSKEENVLLTREEAASYLKITPQTLSKKVKERKIKAISYGRQYRFDISDLDLFLKTNRI